MSADQEQHLGIEVEDLGFKDLEEIGEWGTFVYLGWMDGR